MVKRVANESPLKTSGLYSWPHQTSTMRKTSLGLNLVKHRPEDGPRDPGSACQMCIVYHMLHVMSRALNASCIPDMYTPFMAILCLTVKRVLGIASCRGHCLQELQMEQSCPTTPGKVLGITCCSSEKTNKQTNNKKKPPCTKRQAGKDKGIHTHPRCLSMCTDQKESPKLTCQVEYSGLDYSL